MASLPWSTAMKPFAKPTLMRAGGAGGIGTPAAFARMRGIVDSDAAPSYHQTIRPCGSISRRVGVAAAPEIAARLFVPPESEPAECRMGRLMWNAFAHAIASFTVLGTPRLR